MPLLALPMKGGSQTKECRRLLEVENGAKPTASKEKELYSYNCKDINFVHNLNELRSEFFSEPLSKSSTN